MKKAVKEQEKNMTTVVIIQHLSSMNRALWRYFKKLIGDAMIQDHSKDQKEAATPQTTRQ